MYLESFPHSDQLGAMTVIAAAPKIGELCVRTAAPAEPEDARNKGGTQPKLWIRKTGVGESIARWSGAGLYGRFSLKVLPRSLLTRNRLAFAELTRMKNL